MGAAAARITPADFLTPPELAAYRLATNPAGRIGGVRLELKPSGAGTVVGNCYQQVPMRVLPAFQFGSDRPALVYLVNPTAGLMDGDAQLVELTARSGTRAVVAGQSATRIHPCSTGFATQQWQIRVEPDAILVVLPGPTIPFHGCRYAQRVTIELAANAQLLWGDIWLAGRYARGPASEQFQFATIVQELTVRREGTLVFRDRFHWQGPWDSDQAGWHFGGHPACGSLFLTGNPGAALAADTACFPTAAGDHCCRWQGPSEEVTAAVVNAALRTAAHCAGGTADQPWLLAHADLAATHWFTSAASRP